MNRSRWTVQYMQRVLATDPIAYWIQDEKSGTVSYDMVTARAGGAQNAAYTAAALGQPGIGDGRTVPRFDGATSFNNIFTAAFDAAFDGTTGSLNFWHWPLNVGVWTDGATRFMIGIRTDANNLLYIRKNAANNRIDWRHTSGGIGAIRSQVGVTFTAPTAMGLSWGGGLATAYLGGVQVGAAWAIGAWVGGLNIALCTIGAQNTGPATVTHGYVGHVPVWDRTLSAAEFADLAEAS